MHFLSKLSHLSGPGSGPIFSLKISQTTSVHIDFSLSSQWIIYTVDVLALIVFFSSKKKIQHVFIEWKIILVLEGNKVNIKIIPALNRFMISLEKGDKINIRNLKI